MPPGRTSFVRLLAQIARLRLRGYQDRRMAAARQHSASQVQFASLVRRSSMSKSLGFCVESAAKGVPLFTDIMVILRSAMVALVVLGGYSACAQEFTLHD